MRIPKKQTFAGILIILATVFFAFSQHYSTAYQEDLITNLGSDVYLLQIRGAMNEYLLRSIVPVDYTNRKTNFVYFEDGSPLNYDLIPGPWFEQEGNINAYFNEVNAFNSISFSVNDRSWIYSPFSDNAKKQISEDVAELLKNKDRSNIFFIIGLVFSVLAILINFDIFKRQR